MMLFQDYFRCYFRTKGGKATRESQEALLLIFVIWGCCFGCRGMRVGGVEQKVSFAFSCLVLLGEMGGGGSFQGFNLSLWCESGWLGGRVGSGLLCLVPVVGGRGVRPAALGHWPFLRWGYASCVGLGSGWPRVGRVLWVWGAGGWWVAGAWTL